MYGQYTNLKWSNLLQIKSLTSTLSSIKNTTRFNTGYKVNPIPVTFSPKRCFSNIKISQDDTEKYKNLAAEGSPFAVIKVGGEVVEYELDKLVETIKTLNKLNLTSVVIHGGGPQLNDELKKRNIKPDYIGGHRVTDFQTLEIAKDIFTKLNERVVLRLQGSGVKAKGYPGGVFGAVLATPELGYVGEIKKTYVERVKESIRKGEVPVLGSLATRVNEDEDIEEAIKTKDVKNVNNVLNINADVAAREICLELNPVKVVFTSSKGGWLDEETNEIVSKVNLETEYIKLVNKDYTGRQGTLLKLIEIKLLLDNLPKHSSVSITSASNILETLFSTDAEKEGKSVNGTTFYSSNNIQEDVVTGEDGTVLYGSLMPTKFSVRVGLLGARGYVGREFCKLLLNHSELELGLASSRQLIGQNVCSEFGLEENYANNRGISKNMTFCNIEPEEIGKVTKDYNIHVWVLAMPNGLSSKYVNEMKNYSSEFRDEEGNLAKEPLFIDLSADNRFDDSNEWIYGLVERLDTRERLVGAKKISNPGCYATGTQVALMPFTLHKPETEKKIRLKTGSVPVVFGVSGFSGAGTTPSRTNDIEFLSNNIVPYKLMHHIHEKECSRYLKHEINFIPHVGQFFQGINLTINCFLDMIKDENTGKQRYPTKVEVMEYFKEYFKNEELVRINEDLNEKNIPTVKDIMLKHYVEVGGFTVDEKTGRLVFISLIDNLLKGAATQAIQNINLALGMREFDGIKIDN